MTFLSIPVRRLEPGDEIIIGTNRHTIQMKKMTTDMDIDGVVKVTDVELFTYNHTTMRNEEHEFHNYGSDCVKVTGFDGVS